jgi:DivIVA domain-containing protein
MALTAEDVLNKTFTQTQFRRGYDEREVDDFLDEVVAEMRRMVKDSEDLRGQLEECRAGGGSARVGGAGVGGDAELSRLRAEYHDLQAKYRQVQDRLATESETRSARERELADLRDRLRRADEARVQAGADADAEGRRRLGDINARAEEAERAAQDRIETINARAEEAEASAQRRIKDVTARAEDAERAAQDRIRRAQDEAERAEHEAQERLTGASRIDGPGEQHGPDTAALASAAAGGGGAAGLISLAQRLHDEHVAEGRSQHERLLSEAQARSDEMVASARHRHDELLATAQSQHDELLATAQNRHDELLGIGQSRHDQLLNEATTKRDEMLTEARERATGMVAEAQQKKQQVLAQLGREREHLERQIDQLRGFERDYRARLKSYIEGQLHELDETAVEAPKMEHQST